MLKKVGKVISSKNGYSIHELIAIGEDGKSILCGYCVLSPNRDRLQDFEHLEDAENYLEIASLPSTKRSNKP